MAEQLHFDPIADATRHWREHWGSATAPPMAAVTSIMRAHQLILARLNQALEPHGLTFSRYEALMLLFYSRTGSLPLGKMGARLQVHQTSVTPLIDALEQAGLIRRIPHPTDRRTTLAEITDNGRRLSTAATRDLNRLRFGTAPLKRAELEVITTILERFRREAGDFKVD
jgi:DNA-binding MarR family transcriptional regulator